jgi:CRP-like cAMP-binding protein
LNDGRKIKFEANSQVEAKDWKEAFTRTFAILQTAAAVKGRDEGSVLTKSRRFNVFDLRLSAEEKKSLVDAMQQSASSPENSKARFSVANFFKSSRQQQQQQQDNNANTTTATSIGPSFKVIKSNETAAMIEACLQQNVMVKRLQDIKPLVSCIKGRVALPGEVIIWEGSVGDEFYILEKGQCQVIKDGQMVVGFIQENTSFGELALYNNTIRQATVRVCQLSCIWSFTRQQFRQIANHQNAAAISDKLQFLTQIDLFQKFNRNALEKIAEVMVLRIYQGENERIVKQGDVADRFFMIISGRVLITQSHTLEDLVTGASPKELVRLGPGKYFGESALTENIDHRKATVTSLTATLKCWTIDRSEFVQMFGSLQRALNDSIGFLILKKVKIFESISDAVLDQISQNLESVHYSEGR